VTARVGVITFPGSLDDRDAQRAVRLAGGEPVALWHADADLRGVDAVVLPGGFSYGDYLRAGALARFAPAMGSVVEQAGRGLPVLGICNGFQVLCESGLLPGALTRNAHLHFVNRDQRLRIESTDTAWTRDYDPGQEIAGIRNERGNVVGIMPHPEHAVEELIGTAGTDGLGFFTSVLKTLVDA
jgi:phosphoribosylformylglycinamidine synthase